MSEPTPVRRDVELPGERFDGSLADALGITITDEMRAEYQALLDRIREMENVPMPHVLYREAEVALPDPREHAWAYNRLMLDLGHVVPNPEQLNKESVDG